MCFQLEEKDISLATLLLGLLTAENLLFSFRSRLITTGIVLKSNNQNKDNFENNYCADIKSQNQNQGLYCQITLLIHTLYATLIFF